MKDINNNIDLFFNIEKKNDPDYVKSFVDKYVLLDFTDDEPGFSSILPGRIIDFDGNVLSVSLHDDGTLETKSQWTDKEEGDLFKDFERVIKLDDLNWIYEYSNNLELLGLNDDCVDRDCLIKNTNNVELNCKIVEFDNYTILLEVEVNGEKGHFFLPLIFVSSICFVN